MNMGAIRVVFGIPGARSEKLTRRERCRRDHETRSKEGLARFEKEKCRCWGGLRCSECVCVGIVGREGRERRRGRNDNKNDGGGSGWSGVEKRGGTLLVGEKGILKRKKK